MMGFSSKLGIQISSIELVERGMGSKGLMKGTGWIVTNCLMDTNSMG